jgi:hypothetical protein
VPAGRIQYSKNTKSSSINESIIVAKIIVKLLIGILRTQQADARIVVMCVIVTIIRMSIITIVFTILILIIVTITHITTIIALAF